MSLYAQYIAERTNDGILEFGHGFITFRYLNDKQVYIIDIYVEPEYRKNGLASKYADVVCKYAKEKGITEVIGTVVPSMKTATESVKVLIAYGMKVCSASTDLIVFKKDI